MTACYVGPAVSLYSPLWYYSPIVIVASLDFVSLTFSFSDKELERRIDVFLNEQAKFATLESELEVRNTLLVYSVDRFHPPRLCTLACLWFPWTSWPWVSNSISSGFKRFFARFNHPTVVLLNSTLKTVKRHHFCCSYSYEETAN